jgi:hypothetical protein
MEVWKHETLEASSRCIDIAVWRHGVLEARCRLGNVKHRALDVG